MKLIRAASYQVHGMHAGLVVQHRQFAGPQRWLLRFRVRFPDGWQDTRELAPDTPIPLSALADLAHQQLRELFPDNTTTPVTHAGWTAFVRTR